MKGFRASLLLSSLCVLTALGGAGQANAQSVADFYKGKTITWTWGGEEGGSFDTVARVVIKHLGKHIPGNPNIVMRYMPGAGGLRYANYAAGAEPADGLFVGMVAHNNFVYGAMFPSEVKFDPAKFSYIGSTARVQTVVSMWHDKGIRTIDDAKTRELKMGTTGKGSLNFQDVAIANNLFGTKFRPILGFKGNQQLMLAFERGEVDGMGNTWDAWVTQRPQFIAEKKLVYLVQYGMTRLPELSDVPTALELAKPEDKAVLEFVIGVTSAGRNLFAPPGVPADRLKALRDAFTATMKDPEYIADSEKLKLDTSSSMTGEEVQAVMVKMGTAPEAIRKRAAQIIDLP